MNDVLSTPPQTDLTGQLGYAADDQRNFFRPEAQTEAELQAAGRRARRRHTTWVWIGRIGFAVIVFGGWQLFTELGWVDKFFFGQPFRNRIIRARIIWFNIRGAYNYFSTNRF